METDDCLNQLKVFKRFKYSEGQSASDCPNNDGGGMVVLYDDSGLMSKDCPSKSCAHGGKNCNEPCHMSKACPNEDTKDSISDISKGCFKCHKDGHMAKDCPDEAVGGDGYSSIIIHDVNEIVEKFLAYDTFALGLPVTYDDLITSLSNSEKNIKLFDKHQDYVYFLTKFGCIYGYEIRMCTPIIKEDDDDDIVDFITTSQYSFDAICMDSGLNSKKLKFYWLIASTDEEHYFIDSSKRGKSYIYALGFDEKVKFFAKTFVTFLENLLELCQLSDSDCSE